MRGTGLGWAGLGLGYRLGVEWIPDVAEAESLDASWVVRRAWPSA
jgi:hypothetical protein